MKNRISFLVFVSCFAFLSFSCNQNSDKTPSFGDIDIEAVAADTMMQNNIEVSFEYVKDHPFRNRVFSIVNGGYTGFKDANILEKISMTEFDTLTVLQLDSERIQTSFITDFDGNESPEIHVISRPAGKKFFIDNIITQSGGKWQTQHLSLEKEMVGFEHGESWEADENSLQLNFTDATGQAEIRFILKNNRFITEKADSPKQ